MDHEGCSIDFFVGATKLLERLHPAPKGQERLCDNRDYELLFQNLAMAEAAFMRLPCEIKVNHANSR